MFANYSRGGSKTLNDFVIEIDLAFEFCEGCAHSSTRLG